MRILLISDFFPPTFGGLERHVEGLTRWYVRSGHEVMVFTTGKTDPVKIAGATVVRGKSFASFAPFLFENSDRIFVPPLPDPLLTNQLLTQIHQFTPDIIHSHGWITFTTIRATKNLAIPLVATLHDFGLVCPKRSFHTGKSVCEVGSGPHCIPCARSTYGIPKATVLTSAIVASRGLLDRTNCMIAVSEFVRDLHVNPGGVAYERIKVIPNFLWDEGESNPETMVLPDRFILYVGRLDRHKGVDLLIEAHTRSNLPPLVLVGPAGGDVDLPEDISVLNDLTHPQVMECWRRCEFGVIPSRWPEPCPTVAFEAMSQGKALVAYPVGGIPEIVVHEETGYHVNSADLVGGLREAMAALADDEAWCSRLGKAGAQRLKQRFTGKVIIPQILDLYEQVIAGVHNKWQRSRSPPRPWGCSWPSWEF